MATGRGLASVHALVRTGAATDSMTLLEKLASTLIAGSWVITAGILLLPFLDLDHYRLVAAAAAVYFVSQVVFWVGCAIGGRELVRRYRERFPWLSWIHRFGRKP